MNNTLRDALWDAINDAMPDLEGNIFQPSAYAEPHMHLPSVVVQQAPKTPQMEMYAGTLHNFKIYPTVERTTLSNLDILGDRVIQALKDTVIYVSGIPHYIEYDGTDLEDILIEDLGDNGAVTRSINFRIHELDWLTHLGVEPDPVDAMAGWTKENTNYQHDPMEWTPTTDKPALYWRRGITSEVLPMSWGGWYYVTLHGHLISPSLEERKQGIEELVKALGKTVRVKMSDGSPMMITGVSADDGYDPFGSGQIELEVRYGVLHDVKTKPLKHVYIKSEKVKGEAHVDKTNSTNEKNSN